MPIETATLDPREPNEVAIAFLQASTALTESVAGALNRRDPEAGAAFWSCLTFGGSLELRLETRLSGQRLQLLATPPGGQPVTVLDLAMPLDTPPPSALN